MNIHSPSQLLQPLEGPFHAIGLVGPNEPVTVTSIAKPVFETMKVGVNYVADKLTLSKLVKTGILFGAVQAVSSVPGADAGFVCLAACMGICLGSSTGTGGAFAASCWAVCAPLCSTNPV